MSLTPSGPIQKAPSGAVFRGMRITGNGGPAFQTAHGAENVLVEDSEILAPGVGDDAVGAFVDFGANVTFRNVRFLGGAASLYANGMTGALKVERCQSEGVRGGPNRRGCFVQLDHCTGAHRIVNNISIARPGDGMVDHINLHRSGGTVAAWAEISGNRIRGGNVKSGCGINVGDGGDGGYVRVTNNRMVLVANAAMGISGGAEYLFEDNLTWGLGGRETLTGSVLVITANASKILLRRNRGIVNSWAWNPDPAGPPIVGAGFWTDGTATEIDADASNVWQDSTLTEQEVWGFTGDPHPDPLRTLLLARSMASTATTHTAAKARAQALDAVRVMNVDATREFVELYAARVGKRTSNTEAHLKAALAWAKELT